METNDVTPKKTKKKVMASPTEDSSEMQQTSGDDIKSTQEVPMPEVEPEKKIEPIVVQFEASVDVMKIAKDEN